MAILEFKMQTTHAADEIAALLAEEDILYEHWGIRPHTPGPDSELLQVYREDIRKLQSSRGYQHADVVSLSPQTPGLEKICAKFAQEHFHTEDEVRFVVEGEGIFQISGKHGPDACRITTQPGDLIVIPAGRRHRFMTTEQKHIHCIRLFRNQNGWEAHY